jgi:hypothetical protein
MNFGIDCTNDNTTDTDQEPDNQTPKSIHSRDEENTENDIIIYYEPSNPAYKRFYIEPNPCSSTQPQTSSAKLTRTEIEKSYFKLDSVMKPIKSCSHYKVFELEEIATKLGINPVEFKRKQDLYQKITESLAVHI